MIQEDLDVYDDDFVQIKSILTALGFMTSSSIASIKTQRKLNNIESEYMKIRSNSTNFEPLCAKFPALKGIDSFTSGITATMMDVIAHLNPKKIQQAIALDELDQKAMLESSRRTIVEQAKKV